MILNPYVYGFIPEVKSIFDAMSPVPSPTTKAAINNAVVDLIDAGYFARFDRFGIMQGAEYQQHGLLDWKDATKSIALNGSATWVQADGFVGSQTAGSYGGTGFNLSTDGVNYTQDSASLWFYVNAYGTLGGATSGSIAGAYDGPNMTDLSTDYTPRLNARMNSTSAGNITRANTTLSAGDFIVLQREGASVVKVYKNGVDVTTAAGTTASLGLPNAELFIGALNIASVYQPTDIKIAAWGCGDQISGAEQTSIKAIIDTYLAAV